ncbi:MAG: L,D-transpeptidase [Patescibacteria group bacterium]
MDSLRNQEKLFDTIVVPLLKPGAFGLSANKPRAGFFKLLLFALLIFSIGTLAPLEISLIHTDAVDEVALDFYQPIIIEEEQQEFLPLPLVPAPADRYIIVSLAEQKMQAYENGARFMEAIVSTGRPKYSTPPGEFYIRNKAPMAFSRIAQLYMPYWMAFTKLDGFWLGFHELPQHANGKKEGADHLGQPYSGGCIRLGVGEAKLFYDWARVGDKVLIY